MDEQLTENKEKALLSTKKASGTINKISEMIQDDRYCPDIIQQVDAAIGLLRSVKKSLLKGHFDHCLVEKIKENERQAIEELMKIYNINEK